MKLLQYWQNRPIRVTIKLLFGLAIGAVLYYQTLGHEHFEASWGAFADGLNWQNAPYLILAIILMPLNWTAETYKWLVLEDKVERLSFLQAIQGILVGVTFSLLTPNRIGEYAGRVLYVQAQNRLKTVVATVVGSLAQMAVLLIGGVIALVVFLCLRQQVLGLSVWAIMGVAWLGLIMIAAFLLLYFNVEVIADRLERYPRLARYNLHFNILKQCSSAELGKVLLWAGLRYLIYSLQYLLFVYFFSFGTSLVESLACIGVIFLLQTGLPLPPISGLAVRGGIALAFWGFYAVNPLSILAATFGLWLLNVVLPGMVGALLLLTKS